MTTPRKAALAVGLAAALALSLTSCGGDERGGIAVDPVEIDNRPLGVEDPADVPEASETDDSCEPLKSHSPSDDVDSPEIEEIVERGKLRVGVDQTSYLMGYRDPQTGRLDGFDIRIAREIARDLLGDPDAIHFKVMSSDERIDAVVDGEVDMVVRTMTVNCQRREDVDFSTEYYRAGQKVLVPESATDDVADLAGEKICSSPGSTSLRRVTEELDAEPVSAHNWADCMILVQQGHVAGMTTDDTILAGMAAQDPGTKVIGEPLSEEPYGVAVHLDHEALTRFVNHVLERIREDGTWQDIYDATLKDALGDAEPPQPQYLD
ncbi:MAG: glutamate ABC transporter substrate-binding protein [Stackebrandtia sp.]